MYALMHLPTQSNSKHPFCPAQFIFCKKKKKRKSRRERTMRHSIEFLFKCECVQKFIFSLDPIQYLPFLRTELVESATTRFIFYLFKKNK